MPRKKIGTMGVYIVKNTENNKCYIGSSTNVELRIYEHKRHLRLGTHHSIILQRAFDKYGEACFTFNLIEIVTDINFLRAREQAWFNRFNPEYNVDKFVWRSPTKPKFITDLHVVRSENAKRFWKNSEYRRKIIDAMKLRGGTVGYKCTPEQITNRVRAGRISSMMRWYPSKWQEEYTSRYGEVIV